MDRRPGTLRAGATVLLLGMALLLGPSLRAEAQGPPAPTVLDRYGLADDDPARATLPGALREVSGLTVTDEGRMFAHHDEAAVVFEIDPASGRVVSRFRVGRGRAGDYEGIAAVHDRLFMVDSDGFLLEFRPGRNGGRVPFRGIPTPVGRWCEVEGLTYDPDTRSLLLACKTARTERIRGSVVVFAFLLDEMRTDATPRFRIPRQLLEGVDVDTDFAPSSVVVHPGTGTILLASAREEALIEIDRAGRLLGGRHLSKKRFPKVEGMAVTDDGALYLANEGDGGSATLLRFPLGPVGGGGR